MNMDTIAIIRQEIERNRQAIRVLNEHTAPEQMSKTCAIFQYSDSILSGLLSFLDTLSEEPDKSLEEAAEEYTQQMLESWRFDSTGCRPPRESFKAGAEWQKGQDTRDMYMSDNRHFQKVYELGKKDMKEQMLKDAEECGLYWDGDLLAIDLNMAALGYSERDKVKVIVLKAEEE